VANTASAVRSSEPARWLFDDSILGWLLQHLEDMAFELRELIEEEDAMMRQRHLPGHGHLAPIDQADVGDGVVRGATRLWGDQAA
jgi:hypothetical protein